MKFVVTWTVRSGGSASDNEAAAARSLRSSESGRLLPTRHFISSWVASTVRAVLQS